MTNRIINAEKEGEKMKIKKGLDVYTHDFWYDLNEGYLIPGEILKNRDDVEKVEAAIKVVKEFENSCEAQIEGFIE